MAWDIQYRNGLHLPQIGWWLDPKRPVDRALVSHAHFDHLAAHKEVVCTAPTARFMRERLPRRRLEHALPYGHTEALTQDCRVTLLPAGHICGSALILLEHESHGSLLYTGDFKLRPSRTAGTCSPPPAELLIMESTFGRPQYRFPPDKETLEQLRLFCTQSLAEAYTPLLMAYSLGKTQELLAGLGTFGHPYMLHGNNYDLTRLHEELGLRFPSYRDFDPLKLEGHIVISTPVSRNAGLLKKIPRRRTALISGWALDRSTVYRQGCDAAFPLSDHAGYPDLLALVERVKPRRILTVHGFARELASDLRQLGHDALALGLPNQLDLGL